jgi:Phosphorylase superfamily
LAFEEGLMLTIVTGLKEEADVAREIAAPGTLILCGKAQRDNIHNLVPANCTAIMKFGLCGGLSTELATIGQFIIGDMLTDGTNKYLPDPSWMHRMFARTRAYERRWFSNGLYRDADTPAQRAALFQATGCAVIDDEGLAVAEFAQANVISFAVCGSISDTFRDTVPRAAFNATNPDGTSSVTSVLAWLEAHPAEDPEEIVDLIKIAGYFQTSLAELRTAGRMLGPTLQAQ